MKYSIPVITRMQDNGDGGYSMYAYNTEDELIADHPKSRGYRKVDGELQNVHIELTQEERDYILSEQDPYDDGYIGKDTIEVEVLEDGTIRLAEPLAFSVGQ